MRIVRSFDGYEADADLLLTIGVFDGVHLGHRAVLSRLSSLRRPGTLVGALTFERHPLAFLRPDQAPRNITTVDEKINLLAACGLDILFLLPFDERIANLDAAVFLREVLHRRLRTRALIVGAGWRFGKGRGGDVALAERMLGPLGCLVEAAPVVECDGEKVSSSRIRRLIAECRFGRADELLGSPYTVRGIVTTGEGRGHRLGFPTANLAVPADKLLPPPGVYDTQARHDGVTYRALTSIGDKPTFGGSELIVETYLLDFSRSIYGEQVSLSGWRFVRAQERFPSAQALIDQMHRDVEAVAATHPPRVP
jgi:riboflavin kinase/FMN adenylyltransferase